MLLIKLNSTREKHAAAPHTRRANRHLLYAFSQCMPHLYDENKGWTSGWISDSCLYIKWWHAVYCCIYGPCLCIQMNKLYCHIIATNKCTYGGVFVWCILSNIYMKFVRKLIITQTNLYIQIPSTCRIQDFHAYAPEILVDICYIYLIAIMHIAIFLIIINKTLCKYTKLILFKSMRHFICIQGAYIFCFG